MTLPENDPKKAEASLTLDDIGSGLPAVKAKSDLDLLDKLEVKDLEQAKALELIKNMQSDRDMRQTYANRILRFLEVYAIAVAVLIVLDGFNCLFWDLDKETVIALVGSTAIAAIGLVGFIAKGLFK